MECSINNGDGTFDSVVDIPNICWAPSCTAPKHGAFDKNPKFFGDFNGNN